MSKSVLSNLCQETFEVDSLDISPDTKIREIKDWNSFAHIQLIIAVEEAFSVEFSAEEVQEVETFGELSELIKARGGSFDWG